MDLADGDDSDARSRVLAQDYQTRPMAVERLTEGIVAGCISCAGRNNSRFARRKSAMTAYCKAIVSISTFITPPIKSWTGTEEPVVTFAGTTRLT
jgi:hypothetical protein